MHQYQMRGIKSSMTLFLHAADLLHKQRKFRMVKMYIKRHFNRRLTSEIFVPLISQKSEYPLLLSESQIKGKIRHVSGWILRDECSIFCK